MRNNLVILLDMYATMATGFLQKEQQKTQQLNKRREKSKIEEDYLFLLWFLDWDFETIIPSCLFKKKLIRGSDHVKQFWNAATHPNAIGEDFIK